MECKKCNQEFTPSKGLLNYCSIACRNSRTRPKEIKDAISKSLLEHYRVNPPEKGSRVEVNSRPDKIQKTKETWRSKIDFTTAHYTTIQKYVREVVGCCEVCKISDWRGNKLSLEVHHVNGDSKDNRLENLQVLCPNCHSQTHNWRGRKTKKKQNIVA